MARISRQIGWGQEEVLLFEILRKLERLSYLRCCTTSPTTTAVPGGDNLLLESGDPFLLEDGGNLILE